MSKPDKINRLRRADHFPAGHTPIMANRPNVTGRVPAHDHEFFEIALMAGGRGVHRSVYVAQPVRAGDAFILKPGAWHTYEGCVALKVYNCYFGAELLERELASLASDPAMNYLFRGGPKSLEALGIISFRLEPEALRACQGHIEAIVRCDDPIYGHIERVGHLLLLLGQLARGMGAGQRVASESAPRHPAVGEALRLLDEGFAIAWSLEELARRVHLAPAYLVRLFKRETGRAPMAYLARCRAERAAALLLGTARSVHEIGEAVGWDDPNYFARRFRGHFGVSATEYRERFHNIDSE